MFKETTLINVPRHSFKNIKEARHWAKKYIIGSYRNNNTGEDIRISAIAIDKYLSESATRKSINLDVHLSALKMLPKLLETSILKERKPDKYKDNHIKEIQRLYGVINYERTAHLIKITVKATYNNGNKAYSYEILQIKTPAKGAGGGLSA